MNQSLWKKLSDAQLVQGDAPQTLEIGSPWYVKVLLAFSGWLAAIFILGILFSLFDRVYDNTPILITLGGSFIVGAFFMLKAKGNEFLEHLAFALSLAGQALLAMSVDNWVTYNEEAAIWLVIGLVQLPLALFMPNSVHRVFSSFMATVSFAAALYLYTELPSDIAIYSALLMGLTAWVWLGEYANPKHITQRQMIGYGLVLALIVIKGTKLFMNTDLWSVHVGDVFQNPWLKVWMEELLLSVVSLFVVWKLLQKAHPKPSTSALLLAMGGTLVLTLLSTQAQGLIVGITIILLGFAASNRNVLGLGIITLLFFISSYYYLLDSTLLEKSGTLLILGAALILGYWVLQRVLPTPPQALPQANHEEKAS